MSDSSEEEDLSRFREAVDTTFVKLINESGGKAAVNGDKPSSKRYIEESTHYNDVRVTDELQKRIGAKVSAIISKNIEFVDIEAKVKKRKIKGGVKLFKDSDSFLSCEEIKDTDTELHNIMSKQMKRNKKNTKLNDINEECSENDKINAATVSGEQILLKADTKHWKSRRKEKIFKYKSTGKSKVLVAVE